MAKEADKGGISFLGLLALIFITLKLLHAIEWSWIWVLAPLWGPFAIILTALVVAGIVSIIVALMD